MTEADAEALAAEDKAAEIAAKQKANEESTLKSVEEAKATLDALTSSPDEVADALAKLGKLRIDAGMLFNTKIGMTVNAVRKRFKAHPAIGAPATELVTRWKAVWQLQRPGSS